MFLSPVTLFFQMSHRLDVKWGSTEGEVNHTINVRGDVLMTKGILILEHHPVTLFKFDVRKKKNICGLRQNKQGVSPDTLDEPVQRPAN